MYIDETNLNVTPQVITTVLAPEKSKYPEYDFDFLYDFLSARGYVIYPGRVVRCDKIGPIRQVLVTKLACAPFGNSAGT